MTAIQELIAKIAAIVVLGLGLYFWGHHNGAQSVTEAWQASITKDAVAQTNLVHASDIATNTVITQYVDRVQVVLTQGATITKEVTRVITPQVDATYRIPSGLVRLYNAGASGQALDAYTTSGTDDQPAPVELSFFTSGVLNNLTACRANAEQLASLQDWIRKQQAVME